MNKPSEQNPSIRPAKSGDQTQPAKDTQQPQDPREIAPDIGRKPDAGKSSYVPGTGREDARPPMQAARGDDDVMSQKQRKQP